MTIDIAAVTQRGIDILQGDLPEAEVTGQYNSEVSAWTWTAIVPAPTEENPDAKQGASRQFVPTPEMPEPSDEYLHLVATEIRSTFPTGASA